jgi:hypothetical protein
MAFEDSSLRFYALYVTFTWLGNFVSPFFFCFHLLDIVNRSPTLAAVLQAVTHNGRQLVMTFVLMVSPGRLGLDCALLPACSMLVRVAQRDNCPFCFLHYPCLFVMPHVSGGNDIHLYHLGFQFLPGPVDNDGAL